MNFFVMFNNSRHIVVRENWCPTSLKFHGTCGFRVKTIDMIEAMVLWATIVVLGFFCQGLKVIFTQSEASTLGSLKNTLQHLFVTLG